MDHDTNITKLGDVAAEAGLRRISILAWRDLDDPEAGGSEIHVHEIARCWAEAGVEVTMRTSYAGGRSHVAWRDGYRVIRKAGRYMVFPRAAFSERMGWHGASDGLVEIWNGMPFFSPLWVTSPRVVFLHHYHAEMWQMTLPPRSAAFGSFIEAKLAPPLYRRTPICTPSESSKRELVEQLGFKADRVQVVPPGIDSKYSPGGEKSPTPLVVAVGRLVPVKRHHLLLEVLAELKHDHPTLEAVIAGEGYERDALEAQRRELGAEDWIHLPGRVSDDEIVDLYRRAWVLASTSAREGWGMTITEASACGTPAVATRIAGHEDAVVDGVTGLLADDMPGIARAIDRLLRDGDLRQRMSTAALEYSARFQWSKTALGVMESLAADARRRRSHQHRP
jgi:glycosyltransferase involved in cell wall biosynthesis